MQIYVLKPIRDTAGETTSFELIGVIDEAESVLWQKKYNDVGEAEIYIPCTMEYIEMLRIGNYLYRYDDDMFCKIEKTQIETDVEKGDYLISTAKDACNMLAGRIVRWQIVYSGTVGGFIQKLLNDNVINPAQAYRKINRFEFDDSNLSEFSEKFEATVHGDDLLKLIVDTCKAQKIGFRLSYDIERGYLVFKLYRGKNKASAESDEYIEFSPEFANIISSNYVEDESEYKNLAYISYKTQDEKTEFFSVYTGDTEPTGDARREIFIDGTGTSRDITYKELLQMFPDVVKDGSGYYSGSTQVATSEGTGEDEKITVTDYTYFLLIRAIGQNALASAVRTQSFEGNVDTTETYVYKSDYDLGDTVKVKDDYGNEAEAQILEIMESEDSDNGYSVEPKFEYIS